MILDDQPLYGRSLRRALDTEYEVVLATSVDGALVGLDSGVDVVVADIRLRGDCYSDRQGLEFISLARVRGFRQPILAISAVEDPLLKDEALRAGATLFIAKPLVVSELKRLLQTLGGSSTAEPAAR